jgi:hypothetical protein
MQDEIPVAQKRKWNWRIWVGFLVALATIPLYAAFFSRYPVTRNLPWASWLMFVLAGWLLLTGARRAFLKPQEYRGKIAGLVLGALALVATGLFGYGILYASRQMPASGAAPQIGAEAPDFTLTDTTGKMVSLSALLTEPLPGGAKPRGVVLIFYRGYW